MEGRRRAHPGHKAGDEVRVFTRHLQEATARVPEVVEWARGFRLRELVVEGEAIAMRADGRPQPFQVTGAGSGSRRTSRRRGARCRSPRSSSTCLYLEGEGPLVSLPYGERFERLSRIVPSGSLLPRIVTEIRTRPTVSFGRRSRPATKG
jgi:DNA ligase-1